MTTAPHAGTLSYALVTPARNEEALIEGTLQSVVMQTHLPVRWVIVSDGSTDATERIVRGYAERHPWIELVRVEAGAGRNFARKAHAFNSGYERLRHLAFDLIGNLDADLSFDADYFNFLLQRFAARPHLGVAGTPFVEGGTHYDYRFTDINHVTGCCQLFRRACFEEIGGYVPVEAGIDWIAVTTARMNGWETRTFLEKTYVHHRPMGTANHDTWKVWFRRGQEDYSLGSHPVWHLGRSVYQSASRPYAISGLMLLAGYMSRFVQGAPRSVSSELVRFYRTEQRRRLTEIGTRLVPMRAQQRSDPHAAAVSLKESIGRLQQWVERHDYKGYEPFDGLSSPLRGLTLGNQFLQQLLLQVGRQSPINLRPLLGIKPLESTKGRGYMAWGYLALLRHTGQTQYGDKARACLDWLIGNKSPFAPEYSWGNHFDYASRAGTYARHEAIIVWTALIGQAFLDGYEALGEERYLDVAKSVCNWILHLPREDTAAGICLSYLAGRQLSVHNANLLGAAMLARTAKHTGATELAAVARAAMEYSCHRQRRDGAWYYAEAPTYHWIDSFHTAYNLDSIQCYSESTGDQTFAPHLERGFRYFKASFFTPDGAPKYYSDRVYPIDIQCAAQAIETLAKLADVDTEALAMAGRLARWTIRNMQDPSGYFYYRRYPFMVARIPMLHWGQATMFRALALLSYQLGRGDPRRGE